MPVFSILHVIESRFFQAIMTMVPEAWQGNSLMSMEKKDFYRWISCTMEAWDGPGMYCVEIQLYCYFKNPNPSQTSHLSLPEITV